MKIISSKLASQLSRVGVLSATLLATAAHAVNDLPGGPAVNQLNFAAPATKIAQEQHWLHWMMLIICTVVFIAVFSVMFYSIWKHRKPVGHKPAAFSESITVEILWTAVPFLIVILMIPCTLGWLPLATFRQLSLFLVLIAALYPVVSFVDYIFAAVLIKPIRSGRKAIKPYHH